MVPVLTITPVCVLPDFLVQDANGVSIIHCNGCDVFSFRASCIQNYLENEELSIFHVSIKLARKLLQFQGTTNMEIHFAEQMSFAYKCLWYIYKQGCFLDTSSDYVPR